MLSLINLELKQWFRNKRLFAIVIVFIFSAVVSTVTSYYIKEILESSSSADIEAIIVKEPVWQDLLASYLKNTTQMSLLVVSYLVNQGVNRLDVPSLGLYYRVNSKNSRRYFYPKLIGACIVAVIGLLVGALVTYGIINGLYNDVDTVLFLKAVLLNGLMFISLVMVGVLFSVVVKSNIAAMFIVAIYVYTASLLDSFSIGSDYLLTKAMMPEGLLSGELVLSDYNNLMIIAATLILVSVVLLSFKKLRRTY